VHKGVVVEENEWHTEGSRERIKEMNKKIKEKK
jgi:hypothetical protein